MAFGCLALGLRLACNMGSRIKQLREVERIINYLEGEIRYKHSLLNEACCNVAQSCGQPFNIWLVNLSEQLKRRVEEDSLRSEFKQIDFCDIWHNSLTWLGENSLLDKSDLEELNNVGQALGQFDIQTKENSLMLEKDIIHKRIEDLSMNVNSRMKSTVILCFLSGLMTIILLI